jgi:selenocysteine lyase/cysteine desulfurase
VPEGVAYLNCSYMSPLLRDVREAGEAAIALRARPWTIRPGDFFADSERLRGLAARVMGADADGVALVPSVSYAMAVAAANLPLRPGGRVLVLDEQFPANVYPWRAHAARAGGEVVAVPRPEDDDWTGALLEALDERTAIVAVPNCHWTDGTVLDLVRVGARAREVGAALVVDATQSLGALALDVAEVRPDFLAATTYKWLLGPYSVAYLYAAPGRREGRPLEEGWIVREGAEDFARLVDYRDGYVGGARRYGVGERSNFTLIPMAAAALERLLGWGVERIAATIAPLTDAVEAGAADLGMRVPGPGRRGPHMTGLRLPRPPAPDLAARLAERGVHVSVRSSSIRVSPHVYNSHEDVARLIDALDETVS